ncbi:MAG: hypothetical protein ABIJ43_01645, partial [Candidatus Beckwithbacteria bacterium]
MKNKKRQARRSAQWFLGIFSGLFLVIFVLSVGFFSVKTYLVSMNREEVMIAQITSGSNPTTLSNLPLNGRLKVYYFGGIVPSIQAVFGHNGKQYIVLVNSGSEVMTEFEVQAGDTVTLTIKTHQGKEYHDWVSVEDSRCNGGFKQEMQEIKNSENVVVSQCWDDDGEHEDGWNDIMLAVTQVPSLSPSPSPSPVAIPDCTNLTTNADLNNLQVGTEYSFQLTAGGTAPITDVEMSVYDGISCSSYLLKPYVQQAVSGPGIYTIKWTPTQTGSFIAYGRVWNNGFAECKADCVDGPPRYLCANAPLCKLTGTVKTAP